MTTSKIKIHMRTRCGKDIPVSRTNDGFVLTEACPQGCPAGSRTGVLLDLCGSCPQVQEHKSTLQMPGDLPPSSHSLSIVSNPPLATPQPLLNLQAPQIQVPTPMIQSYPELPTQQAATQAVAHCAAPSTAMLSGPPASFDITTAAFMLPPSCASSIRAAPAMTAPPSAAIPVLPVQTDTAEAPMMQPPHEIEYLEFNFVDMITNFDILQQEWYAKQKEVTVYPVAPINITEAPQPVTVAVPAQVCNCPEKIVDVQQPAPPPVADPIPAPIADVPITDAISLDFIGLPGTDDESTVDIDEAMKGVPGMVGGPSEGGFSSHMLQNCECWRKAYYSMVLGLTPTKRSMNFSFGTLFHACLAMRYQYGSHRQWEPIDAAIQAGAPKLARDVRTLLEGLFTKYEWDEYHTYCTRAVEHNFVYFSEPVTINGKKVIIPFCGRIDWMFGLKEQADACPGMGPMPNGVYIVDHKTTSSLTYDLTNGFGMDYQMRFYALGFQRARMAEQFGPLAGIMVNIASKQYKKPTEKSYFRARATMNLNELDDFYVAEVLPIATELYKKLSDPETRANESAWPRDHRRCTGRWGACEYFLICDGGCADDRINYREDPKRVIDVTKFCKPAKGGIPITDGGPTIKASVEKAAKEKLAKKEIKDGLQRQILNAVASGVAHLADNNPAYSVLNKGTFLQPGFDEKEVKSALTAKLAEFYSGSAAQGIKYEQTLPNSGSGAMMTFTKTGLAWVSGAIKGKLTWKQIADEICAIDWFNVNKVLPPA